MPGEAGVAVDRPFRRHEAGATRDQHVIRGTLAQYMITMAKADHTTRKGQPGGLAIMTSP
jgi:hypothetical protein